ncbi:Neutrophil gelatinase-associated lipocalin [Heterocephalus glaber]|uniref:Neutrophil gelatinase-associated lipocalin n=1 Tax=Heterocephalus glaber TaxID=10181 RepID=G5ASF9_HETGA|nr:Neutrophil gelatinase-associated lipocalin [Heterocephalus glaber]
MALGLLCLGLILLGGLQTKAFFPDMIKIPPLNKVPFQPDFQDDQFQGKWYSLGVADNTIQNGNGSQLTMYSVNYELQDDHSFNVNTSMLRDEVCEHSVETLFPGFQPGQFTLGNLTSYRGVMSYIVRVAATNYSHFAMVYVEKIVRFKWYYKMTLYGRTKKLRHKLKERFIKFTTSLDFTKDNIAFSVPIGNDQMGEGGGDMRFSRPDAAQSTTGDRKESISQSSHRRGGNDQSRVCSSPGILAPSGSLRV